MDECKPLRIVMIEDNVKECDAFMKYAETRQDIDFVGMTGRSADGLELVKTTLPQAVIVDLELSYGSGSGFQFLDGLKETEFNVRPIVVITTRNRSDSIHSMLHDKYGIDNLFYKKQEGYGPEMVINHLMMFREYYFLRDSSQEIKSPESPEEVDKRIRKRIKAELDQLGMSIRYKGRRIAEEAIFMLVKKKQGETERVFNELARKLNTPYVNVTRNIQNAINKLWNNPDNVEELVKYYTAPVSKETGSPTSTEFVHYYSHMIRGIL